MPAGRLPFESGGPLHQFRSGGDAPETILVDEDVRTLFVGAYAWNYLTTTLPTGVASSTLKALYQFDGPTLGLTDRSGNGHNLSVSGSDFHWQSLQGSCGCNALQVIGSTWAQSALTGALGTLGVATMEILFKLYENAGDPFNIYASIGVAAEGEAENTIFAVYGNDTYNFCGVFHERGGGTNVSALSSWGAGATGFMSYLCMTRASDGVTYNLYIDGVYLETIVLSDPPTGGTSTRALIGSGGNAGNESKAAFNSMRWSHAEFTAAQVQEAYYRIRGWIS